MNSTESATPTYANRHMLPVAKVTGDQEVKFADGFSGYAPPEVVAAMRAGQKVEVEIRGFNRITGWTIDGEYLWRKSEQDLDEEWRQYQERVAQERQERLDSKRAEWTAREARLPDWIKARLDSLRANSGESFDEDGWGYELVVCELANMYDLSNLEETDWICRYDEREGCSGNQHNFALALARAHREGQGAGGTVAALSPITGKAAY